MLWNVCFALSLTFPQQFPPLQPSLLMLLRLYKVAKKKLVMLLRNWKVQSPPIRRFFPQWKPYRLLQSAEAGDTVHTQGPLLYSI